MVPPTDLFGHGQALRVGDGGELLLLQFLNGVLVISQIKLGSYQDDWSVWTVVSHFWIPLNTHNTFQNDQNNQHKKEMDMSFQYCMHCAKPELIISR